MNEYIVLKEAVGHLIPNVKYKISEETNDYYIVGNVLIPKNLKSYIIGHIVC